MSRHEDILGKVFFQKIIFGLVITENFTHTQKRIHSS